MIKEQKGESLEMFSLLSGFKVKVKPVQLTEIGVVFTNKTLGEELHSESCKEEEHKHPVTTSRKLLPLIEGSLRAMGKPTSQKRYSCGISSKLGVQLVPLEPKEPSSAYFRKRFIFLILFTLSQS